MLLGELCWCFCGGFGVWGLGFRGLGGGAFLGLFGFRVFGFRGLGYTIVSLGLIFVHIKPKRILKLVKNNGSEKGDSYILFVALKRR